MPVTHGRWRQRRLGGQDQEGEEQRSGRQASAGRAQAAHGPERTRRRDRRCAIHRRGRRTGAASRPGADRLAEFSADRRHHRPVPHRRSAAGRHGAPRIRGRRQRALGAAQFPLLSAAAEEARDRVGRCRAICRGPASAAAGACAGRGMNVTIAVIDSGVDAKHPELANSVADSFDALGSRKVRMSTAPASPARSSRMRRLMGSAPEARIAGDPRIRRRDRRARRAPPL